MLWIRPGAYPFGMEPWLEIQGGEALHYLFYNLPWRLNSSSSHTPFWGTTSGTRGILELFQSLSHPEREAVAWCLYKDVLHLNRLGIEIEIHISNERWVVKNNAPVPFKEQWVSQREVWETFALLGIIRHTSFQEYQHSCAGISWQNRVLHFTGVDVW